MHIKFITKNHINKNKARKTVNSNSNQLIHNQKKEIAIKLERKNLRIENQQ